MSEKIKKSLVTDQGVSHPAAEALKMLIEFCLNENIRDPKITMEAKLGSGEKYKLVFERVDLNAEQQ